MKPVYIKLFGFELMLEPNSYQSFRYLKESDTERELEIGKLRLIISG